ncbi:glutathione S-transferase-like protein [Calothrix sp. NIES-3974]|nr:glutathione S-transferase-like protein [Calothrix sp. NIES-3974]
MWQMMMQNLAPKGENGAYIRPESQFRNWIKRQENHIYQPDEQRYHLYVGTGCPWAHRTLVVRAIKGLEATLPITIVKPAGDRGIWVFSEIERGCQTLPELYNLAKPGYQGRCTVPVLWDNQTQTIVNNESAEIIIMLNSEFNQFAKHPELDLYPEDLRAEIEQWNEKIYHTVNNGVYRCGFAQTQLAYETAVGELFTTLDEIDKFLKTNAYTYLCGDKITLADVRLFTTLLRFDVVYYGLFKCNLRRIQDYENLSLYLQNIYELPGVAETCDIEQIKQDYYGNLFPLNPGGIIPIGPELKLVSGK